MALTQMVQSADPGHRPLDAESEAGMRHRSVPAQVEIPVERRLREIVFFDAREQRVEVVFTLAPADDLAVPFRRKHVHRQGDLRVLRDPASYRTPSLPTDTGAPSPDGRTAARRRSHPCRRDHSPTRRRCRSCAGSSTASSYVMRGSGAFTFSSIVGVPFERSSVPPPGSSGTTAQRARAWPRRGPCCRSGR